MNSFRLGTIGLMVEHWGIAAAEGFLHEFQGWLVFMVSAGLMMGEVAVLTRIGSEAGDLRQLFGVEFPAPSPKGAVARQRRLPRSFLVACGLLVAVAAISWLAPRPAEIRPSRSSFIDFPMQLGALRGKPETMDGIYIDALRFDDYLLADYVPSEGGAPVNVYMAYYNSQRKGEAVHSPRACLPGGGWQLSEFDQRSIEGVTVGGRPLRVNRTIIAMGDRRQLVYYWFQQRGRIVTNEFAVKWYLFWDALTLHRTDGALIRLIIELPRGSSVDAGDRRLVDVAQRIAPLLPRFVPN
jgi:exosortase D (VPLPA-CTERM-specific)